MMTAAWRVRGAPGMKNMGEGTGTVGSVSRCCNAPLRLHSQHSRRCVESFIELLWLCRVWTWHNWLGYSESASFLPPARPAWSWFQLRGS